MALDDQDLLKIQALIDNHDKALEPWSFSKFFSGFFRGQNYAKALVFGVCFIVILIIVFSVGSVVKSKFHKTNAQPTQAVGTNQGVIQTKNEDKSGNTYSLFNLVNWK